VSGRSGICKSLLTSEARLSELRFAAERTNSIQAHVRSPSVSGFVVKEKESKRKGRSVCWGFLSVRVWYALWKR
jgi:hypothetical protein